MSELEFSYGPQLAEAVRRIVRDRVSLDDVLHTDNIPEPDWLKFDVALGDAIGNLDLHNCTKFGLSVEETRDWIEAGRPASPPSTLPQPDHNEDPGAVIPLRK